MLARRAVVLRSLCRVLAAVAACGLCNVGWAQGNGGNNGNGGRGGQAGVMIDAQGVLLRNVVQDPTGQLTRQQALAAKALFKGDLAQASKLRKVSLNRLESAVQAHLAAGNAQPTAEMLAVAGLTRVQNVFFLPETNDVVIAGPAEPWFTALDGSVLGTETGRPIIRLDDLVVALRCFAPGKRGASVIGCSIDPTQQGLANLQKFLNGIGGYATPAHTAQIVNGIRTNLGMQTVSVLGVSSNTSFAQVLVAADYRMKLIGIGLEPTPVKLSSYVELAGSGRSNNALVRWYFTPHYDCVKVSADGLAMEMLGQGVKLVGEDELVTGVGQRVASAPADRASQLFVKGFTEKYAELAAKVPVFAHLRNLIDLSIAAAFVQKEDYYGKANWQMPFFGNEQSFAVETAAAPKQVETAVNAIWKGNRLLTPLGGGVNIQPRLALESSSMSYDDDGKLGQLRETIHVRDLPADRWWWD